jgi:pyruvate/2-oxoglutarate dehydrogenase complex dihydrolipoamide dehydrogenase (E3) component
MPATADLAVIGAGSGGLSVASGAAQLGLDVVLFERGEMGGDCLNYGCVPSKALIAAANAAHAMRTGGALGVSSGEVRVDFAAVMAHVHGAIAAIAPHDSQERFEGLGVQVIREHARFLDGHTLASRSLTLRAKRIVIATGSRAAIPPIPGLKDLPFLTNETIFGLTELPRRLLVIGGGPIGVELGQAFRRLGSEVVIVTRGAILAREDPDAAAIVADQLRADGIELLPHHKLVEAKPGADADRRRRRRHAHDRGVPSARRRGPRAFDRRAGPGEGGHPLQRPGGVHRSQAALLQPPRLRRWGCRGARAMDAPCRCSCRPGDPQRAVPHAGECRQAGRAAGDLQRS